MFRKAPSEAICPGRRTSTSSRNYNACPRISRRVTIFTEFGRIQAAGKVKAPQGRDHYAFHDLRRAFATLNADRLTPDAMQLLMEHKDYQTTQSYIAMARHLKPAAQNLFVPDLQAKPAAVSG